MSVTLLKPLPGPIGDWVCLNSALPRSWLARYFFRHSTELKWAIADSTVNDFFEPQSADGGLQLIDLSRSVNIALTSIRVPVILQDGNKHRVTCSMRNLNTVVSLLHEIPTLQFEIAADLRDLVDTTQSLLRRHY